MKLIFICLFFASRGFAVTSINDGLKKIDNLGNLLHVASAFFVEDNYYDKTLKFLKSQSLDPKKIKLEIYNFSENKLYIKGFPQPIIFNFNKNSVSYFGIEVQSHVRDTPQTFYNKVRKSWGGFKPFNTLKNTSNIVPMNSSEWAFAIFLNQANAEELGTKDDILPMASMTMTGALIGALIAFPLQADHSSYGASKESFLKLLKRGIKGGGIGASVPLFVYAIGLVIDKTYETMTFDPTKPRIAAEAKAAPKIALKCGENPGLGFEQTRNDPLKDFWRKVCQSEDAVKDFNEAILKVQNKVINKEIVPTEVPNPSAPAQNVPSKPQS